MPDMKVALWRLVIFFVKNTTDKVSEFVWVLNKTK
jgi:hypothetical protein